MIVRIMPEAEADLAQIGDAIAIDNPDRAISYVGELREKALHLRELPRGFPIVPALRHLEVRRRNHGNYAIFYIVEANEIRVLRVIHGSRDFEAIFPVS